jgi:hypothetical protein
MAERIPVAQHKLRGTFRRDRHGIGVEFQPTGEPSKPEGISAAAERFWIQHIQPLIEAGVVGDTDQATCEGAARWYAELCRVQDELSRTKPTAKGYYKLATLAGLCQKQFNSLCQSLGLSPYHRRRVRASAGATASGIAKRNRYIKAADGLADRFFHDEPADKSRFFKGAAE